MRVMIFAAACLLTLSVAAWHPSNISAATDLTGKWELTGAFPDAGITGMDQGEMELTQTGRTFTGTIYKRPIKGTIDGANVALTVSYEGIPHDIEVVYTGKLIDPNTMKGTVTFPQYGKGTWTATRR